MPSPRQGEFARMLSIELSGVEYRESGNHLSARWNAIATKLLMLFLIFSPGAVRAAQGADQASGVEDVVSTRHLIPAGDLYTDGTNKFLCVRTGDGKPALWNPADGALHTFSDKSCEIGSNLHMLNFTQILPFGVCEKLPENCGASFSNAKIYVESPVPVSGRCGPELNSYYRVVYSDGITNEFYLVRKLLKPYTIAPSEYCVETEWNDSTRPVVLKYDEMVLESVDIGNGKTLLYSYGFEDSIPPVLLIVTKLPDTMWSSAGTIFFIPKQKLYPKFTEIGTDLGKRYEALLRVIGGSGVRSGTPHKKMR